MAKKDDDKLREVHRRAMREFNDVQCAVRDERMQCLQDRRFYQIAGAMWEAFGEQFANKPKLEANKIMLSIIRIISEYRKNRITVDFLPKDGSSDDKMADACDGLYRADEQDSKASLAFDNAFHEGVGGGMGAFRLRACYEDEESEDEEYQRIKIEPIYDADSTVFFDLNAKMPDKSDAKRCWVLTPMTRTSYIEEHGDDPATWPKDIDMSYFDWAPTDVVYLAEYYEIEEVSDTIRVFEGMAGDTIKLRDSDLENEPDKLEEMEATGYKLLRKKPIKKRKCHKYIMNGNRVLEDGGFIAGKHIPVVPYYGKHAVVDGVERVSGHVRLAKDMQMLKNMEMSKLAEISAGSSIEKPIFTREEIVGNEKMWADDNIENFSYLLRNRETDQSGQPVIAPIDYTRVAQVPPAMVALLQLTESDIKELLGNQQAGEELRANVSDDAIELVQTRLDMQVYIYIDNLKTAVKRAGEIWLAMASDLYVEQGRKMKTISNEGKPAPITLMRSIYNEKTAATEYENDFSKAMFDVVAEVGPSSSTKRRSTVKSLLGMMQASQDPETNQVLGATAMMNMEGEGIGDVRDYFRQKLIKMGVVKPTDEEAAKLEAEAQNQPPDPNTTYLQAAAQEAEAKAAKARADTVLTVANAGKARAETAKTLTEIDLAQTDQIARHVQQLDAAFSGSAQ